MSDATKQTREVLDAARRVVEAYARFDRRAYFAAFHPDATFVFYNLDVIHPDRAAYERAWDEWADSGGRVVTCRSEGAKVQLMDHANALFTHEVFTTLGSAEGSTDVHERETIVFSHIDGHWLAVHEHLSPFPD